MTVLNALTIDVEDYFHVSAFAPYIARADWDRLPCRVERNVERILGLLAEHEVQATFFALGWLAARYPGMVRAIVAAGHELASHGEGHERATALDRHAFAQDVGGSRRLLEDGGGVPGRGYRAPSFSIDGRNPWAFDVLAEQGYAYSSSVYPVRHDHYGAPDSPRAPYRVAGGLLEIPLSTVRIAGRNLPASGGGWFRMLPYGVSRWMLSRINRTEGRSAVFYFHPWEIDPDQPRIAGLDARTRLRHYLQLARTEAKLDRLLSDFRWGRMDRVFLGSRSDGAGAAPAMPAMPRGAAA